MKPIAALFASLAAAWLLVNPALAEPLIRNVQPRGLQVGATTTLVIDGADLLPDPKLLLGVPIAAQSIKPGGTANRIEVEVALDASVTGGLYNLRVANAAGISAAEVIAVDALPQAAFAPEITTLPTAMHGVIGGSQTLKATLAGKAGQELLVEVEAARLGSKLRPVIHLYDAKRVQIAYAWPTPTLGGDCRLAAKLPIDGPYTIELHDSQYGVPGPGHFRLKVGTWQYVDQVFPAAVQRGKPAAVELVGNVPLTPQSITAAPAGGIAPAEFTGVALSGARPRVIVSDLPEVIEAPANPDPANMTLQELSVAPVAVNGRLAATGERDRYRLSVNPGDKLRLELFAARLGSPLDTNIEIQNDQGAFLAGNDDAPAVPTTDSQLEYTVPADVKSLVVVVRDVHDRGGKQGIYRLVATPADPQRAKPDFRLTVSLDRQNVPRGGTAVLQVLAERQGYEGPIRVAPEQLPPGVIIEGGEIPAGATGTLITLRGADGAPAPLVTRIRGLSVGVEPPIERLAQFETHPLAEVQPWLQQEVAVALAAADPFGLQANWGDLPADHKLVIGQRFMLPVKLTRPVADGGPVRVTFLVSQQTPRVNGNPDINQLLRSEQPLIEVQVDPAAKQAADALAAAAKVLTDAQAKQAADADAATKANTAAQAVVQDATTKKTAAEKASTDAAALAKTAADGKTAADTALATVQAALKTAQDTAAKANADAAAKVKATTDAKAAADQGTDEAAKKTAADALAAAQAEAQTIATAQAKAVADTTAAATESTTKQQAAAKSAADTAAAAKTAADALAAAMKVLADAETKAAATKTAGEQTLAADEAVVKDAAAKRDAADAAAKTAAANAKHEAAMNIVVPGNLPNLPYELTLRAELVSADRQRVLSTSYTPVRKVESLNPIAMKLTAPAPLSGVVDPKAGLALKLTGTLERLAGLQGDVTLVLESVPPGVPQTSFVVKADQTAFELPLNFPANFAPGEVKGIIIAATGRMNPQAPEIVRSVLALPPVVLTAPPAAQ